MFDEKYKFTCADRFLKYVKYDTQSDEDSTTFPSTEKQKILSKDLAEELKKIFTNLEVSWETIVEVKETVPDLWGEKWEEHIGKEETASTKGN